MNDLHSQLTQEVRNGFIDLRSLHKRIAEERYELEQKNLGLRFLLTASAFAIVFCLLSINDRLSHILEANSSLEPNSGPAAIALPPVEESVPRRAP